MSATDSTDSARPAPTAPSARIESLDVVRGVALLGILLLNILYGLPGLSYFTPVADGALSGINFAAFVTVETLFEGVMRGLFSMLFGAGVALFADGRGAGPYYRRQVLLLGFGVFNALVLMFSGDILVTYALAGFILYFARNWRPRTLLIVAGVVYLWLGLLYGGLFSAASYIDQQAGADQASAAACAAIGRADGGGAELPGSEPGRARERGGGTHRALRRSLLRQSR